MSSPSQTLTYSSVDEYNDAKAAYKATRDEINDRISSMAQSLGATGIDEYIRRDVLHQTLDSAAIPAISVGSRPYIQRQAQKQDEPPVSPPKKVDPAPATPAAPQVPSESPVTAIRRPRVADRPVSAPQYKSPKRGIVDGETTMTRAKRGSRVPPKQFTIPKPFNWQLREAKRAEVQQREEALQASIKAAAEAEKPKKRKPKPRFKANPVPDFARLQADFEAQLRARKATHPPTETMSYTFNSGCKEKLEAARAIIRAQVAEDETRGVEDRWPYMLPAAPMDHIVNPVPHDVLTPGSVKLEESKAQKLINKERAKAAAVEEREAEAARQHARRLQTMKKLIAPFAKTNQAELQRMREEQTARFTKQLHDRKRETRKMMADIKRRVQERPFLLEMRDEDEYRAGAR